MKKILTAAILASALTCGAAETVEFSYANAVENFLGIQAKETYDVAIFLPANQFKDLKVASVKIPVNTNNPATEYNDISVWISTELKVSSGKNSPDVSYPASIGADGNISLELPEAYTVTDKGAYIGYTLSVKTLNSTTKFPIAIGGPMNPNGLFIRTSKSVTTWQALAEDQDVSSAISVGILSDNLESESVSFDDNPENIYAEVGKETTVSMKLFTFGTSPVSSVDVDFSIAGKASSFHYDFETPVPAKLGSTFVVPVVIPAQSSKMSDNVEFVISKVNGVENKAGEGAKASATFSVLSKLPKHIPLIEEYTGVKCPYCPRGFAALEYIKENYPEYVLASYHNEYQGPDPMACVTTFPNQIPGNPYAFLDRSVGGDPYYGTQTYDTILPILGDIEAIIAKPTPWEVKVSYSWKSDSVLVANAEVCSYAPVNGKYKIAYILVSDGLTGKTASWRQSNGFSRNKQDPNMIPQFNDFCSGGKYGKSTVSGLIFNDIVISSQGILGVDGSIPADVAAEEKVSHSFEFDLTKVDADLLQDKTKLRIIAVVLDPRGVAMNCAKVDVTEDINAVEGIETEATDAPVEYYNLNGVKVDNPSGGIYIRRQGNRTSKVIIK